MAIKKVQVEVIDGVVDGKGKGAKLSISEKTAARLKDIGYVKVLPAKRKQPKSTEKK